MLVSTEPHLYIVSGWTSEVLQEPWWTVPLTAGVVWTTSSTVPERIIRVENILVKASACRVTKVVVSDEGRHWRRWGDTGVDAGAYTSEVRVVLV